MPFIRTITLISSFTISVTSFSKSPDSLIDVGHPIPSSEQATSQSSTNQDYFGELQDLFQDSGPTTMEEILGWWSGRCYTPNNILVAGLLVGSHRAIEEHGPMFPPRYEDKFLIAETVHDNNLPADYFDNLSEVRKMELELHINDHLLGNVTEASTRDGSLYTERNNAPYQYRLRKSGEYFLSEATAVDTPEHGPTATRVFRYCYFFKKIR